MAIIGIDVSKAKLDCLWLRDSVSLKVKSRVFPNTPAGYSQGGTGSGSCHSPRLDSLASISASEYSSRSLGVCSF